MACVQEKLEVLTELAKDLNEQKIRWAVGGSLLLYIKGKVEHFEDIDLMVAEEDIEQLKKLLPKLGIIHPREPHPQYKTKYFVELNMKGVDIDFMAGFIIVYEGEDYYFPLEEKNIVEYVQIHEQSIPLQSLNDWKKYYALMGRSKKVEIIETVNEQVLELENVQQ